MRAWIAEIICCLAALTLTGCSTTANSVFGSLSTTSYRYNEDNLVTPEDQFIDKQYDALYRGDIDVVINKRIDLCDYRKLLFVRVSSHSTWLPEAIRNSVMNDFHANRFFEQVKTSEPIVYINAEPYPAISIHEDDVFWYSQNDPVTVAWLKRFVHEDNYIVADAILNETNIDAGLLRAYAFELRLLDSNDGAVIVSFLSRRSSLNKRPEAIIASTIERINGWLARVGSICESRPPEVAPDCIYEK